MSVTCECGKVFKTKNSYNSHRNRSCKSIVKNTGTFTCPFCQIEYSREDNCVRHIKVCTDRPASLTEMPRIDCIYIAYIAYIAFELASNKC